MTDLNIKKNRKTKVYSNKELLLRVLWSFGRLVFRCSPRIFFGYRNFILRMFGAKVGQHVHIYASAHIYFPWNLEIGDWSAIGEKALVYNLGKIKIGSRVTISHKAHLCAGTHDYLDPNLPLLKSEITIEDNVWVSADAFVGPDVKVGEGAVIGARGCVYKDVEPWIVVGGNPAKFIKKRILKYAH